MDDTLERHEARRSVACSAPRLLALLAFLLSQQQKQGGVSCLHRGINEMAMGDAQTPGDICCSRGDQAALAPKPARPQTTQ